MKNKPALRVSESRKKPSRTFLKGPGDGLNMI